MPTQPNPVYARAVGTIDLIVHRIRQNDADHPFASTETLEQDLLEDLKKLGFAKGPFSIEWNWMRNGGLKEEYWVWDPEAGNRFRGSGVIRVFRRDADGALQQTFRADGCYLETIQEEVLQSLMRWQQWLEQGRGPRGKVVANSSPADDPSMDASGTAATEPKGNRRKHRQQKPKKLTAKQLEAVEMFGKCESNYSEAARKMGISRNAFRDHINAAYWKLGQKVPTMARTQSMPTDRRGGASVAAGPKPESQGNGMDRSGHNQRLG
jgi:predicted DNA-binding protein (UPF0251 family)